MIRKSCETKQNVRVYYMIHLYLENNRCGRGAIILLLVTINPAFYTLCIWCTWCKLKPYFLSFFLTFCLFKKENKTIHYNSREGHDSLSINLGMKCNMTARENIFLITSEANTKNIESFSTKYTEFTFLVIIYER